MFGFFITTQSNSVKNPSKKWICLFLFEQNVFLHFDETQATQINSLNSTSKKNSKKAVATINAQDRMENFSTIVRTVSFSKFCLNFFLFRKILSDLVYVCWKVSSISAIYPCQNRKMNKKQPYPTIKKMSLSIPLWIKYFFAFWANQTDPNTDSQLHIKKKLKKNEYNP